MPHEEKKTLFPDNLALLKRSRDLGYSTGFDRLEEMEPQCSFGLVGLCCQRCFNGPCRISLFEEGPKQGVCGATSDTLVARHLYELLTAGAAQHAEHAREVVRCLLEVSEGKSPYTIVDEGKLRSLAQRLGVASPGDGKSKEQLAKEVALKALEDISQFKEGALNWLKLHAHPDCLELWSKLGILPMGAHPEIASSVVRTSMGCDADPLNLILGALRMALIDGFLGLHMATDLQDVLLGTPKLVKTTARMAALEKGSVNLLVHGHIPLLSHQVVKAARRLEEEAKKVGAEGVNVLGLCCTGNEAMMRQGVPLLANFSAQELALMTGLCDAMVVDVQCIMPSLPQIAQCFHTEVITTLPYIKLPGATAVDFSTERAEECAEEIVRKAITSFKRRDMSKAFLPQDGLVDIYGGFSTEQIVEALARVNGDDPLLPLIESVKSGSILGIVAIVGCTGFKQKHDSANVELAKHLLRENVLLVTTGCSGHSLCRTGLAQPTDEALSQCGAGLRGVLKAVGQASGLPSLPPVLHMGSCVDNSRVADVLVEVAKRAKVKISQLPALGSCPEMQSPKALSIGAYFLAMGVDVHIGVPLPVYGSEFITNLFCGPKGCQELTCEGIFGSRLIYEPDPHKAAQVIIERLKEKRKSMGL